ncbi:hypothetical protein BCV70DRAFT_197210 [Testicularia cyperi]|uniref:HECT-type E3 ubiquitin transferase n=1 Tax=Testicularia cyperi TaxID=1882483 RepID=A0A317XXH3_9BASI|nr:hypothetical protein BCV70DRAFT_197210 [Testicularia cyperi]
MPPTVPASSPWAAKKAAWSSLAAQSTTSADPTPSSASAFPPLSGGSGAATPSRSTASSSSSPWKRYTQPSTSFNPYPTRNQELAMRAASHGDRRRSQVTRRDPVVSTLWDLDDDDRVAADMDIDYDYEDGDDGEVSARGATMSSIVFRDLSSAGTSRSASPWQANLSPGLAMFANSAFGGEPLKALAFADEALGAAHLGPRIYRRHNQSHVKARKGQGKTLGSAPKPSTALSGNTAALGRLQNGKMSSALPAALEISTLIAIEGTQSPTIERLQELPTLLEQYRREQSLAAIQQRSGGPGPSQSDRTSLLARRIRDLVEEAAADPTAWSLHRRSPPVSNDLLPVSLANDVARLDSTPVELVGGIRRATLSGIKRLLRQARNDTSKSLHTLSGIFANLLGVAGLRPTNALDFDDATLKVSAAAIFVDVLQLIIEQDNPDEFLLSVLRMMERSPLAESDALRVLTSDLVGFCGQQMAGNPAVLDEHQDQSLVAAGRVLASLYRINAERRASDRLPSHAFYCTVLDLCPFLEHFVHHAASLLLRDSGENTHAQVVPGLAQFNVCRFAFLLSLGAKVRMLQFENELRLDRGPKSHGGRSETFSSKHGGGELVLGSTSIKLKVQREQVSEQSRDLLVQLLDHCVDEDAMQHLIRPLRVEFDGEQAADGGGPTREWFATVAVNFVPRGIGARGWFAQSASEEAVTDARALGLLLGLAALCSTKLALGFDLASVGFRIATAADLDTVRLTPADLEQVDGALANSLQTVLDWTPSTAGSSDAETQFENTFTLTWSTTIRDAGGEISSIDLVPGGRHRAVRYADRREFVSRLIWRVLVGSVREQVAAFRAGWQAVMPAYDAAHGADTSSGLLCRGGIAIGLFEPDELRQAVCSLPQDRGSESRPSLPLDIANLQASTDVVGTTPLSSTTTTASTTNSSNTQQQRNAANASETRLLAWFWNTWTELDPQDQRKLLAFITGSQDIPLSGARGIGLRIHLVHAKNLDLFDRNEERAWPLPWSSTCTSTLFLPTYPTSALLEDKLRIAIEHYQGFGLR